MLGSLKMSYDLISPLSCFLPLSPPCSLLPHIYIEDDHTGKYSKSRPCLRWGANKTSLQGKKTPTGIPTRQLNSNVCMLFLFAVNLCHSDWTLKFWMFLLLMSRLALPAPFTGFAIYEFISPIEKNKQTNKIFQVLEVLCNGWLYEFIS